MKKFISLFITATLISSLLGCGGQSFEVNTVNTSTGNTVSAGLSLFVAEGFSFLFPAYDEAYTQTDLSVVLYKGESKDKPFITIKRNDVQNMTPEKFFKMSDAQLKDSFEKVASTKILETNVDNKTLYMVRYVGTDNNTDTIVERYVEIYDDFYIMYTCMSDTANELNTEAYYAIKTLRTTDGAYVEVESDGFRTDLASYIHPDMDFSIDIPAMLETRALTIGYLSTSENAVMLSVVCKDDENGNQITSRDDFLKIAANDPDFIANYMGVDAVSFGLGESREINGESFYAYPVFITLSDALYTGEMLLGNYDNACMVILYGVDNDYLHRDEALEVFKASVNTINY